MQKKDQPTLTTFQYFSLQRPEEKGRSNPGGAGSECHESGCWADLRFCGSHRLWHSICACVLAATHVWAILAMNGRWIVSMVFAPSFNFDNENSLSIAQTHPVCLFGLPNWHKSIRGEEVRDFRPLDGTSAQISLQNPDSDASRTSRELDEGRNGLSMVYVQWDSDVRLHHCCG